MASMLVHFEVDDYDSWKKMFDSDPLGRRQSGTKHILSRSVDSPNAVFLRVDFPSLDEAKAFHKRLIDSGHLERPGQEIKLHPTVVEQAEDVTY